MPESRDRPWSWSWPLRTLVTDSRLFQNGGSGAAGNEHLAAIAKAVKTEGPPSEFKYEERDAILYNLGIGAKRTELKYVL